eukprot:GHRR01024003.1.p1 GENE.GHRR01024003.1~~GHRR01024003.1.p1  ORF type:complete len:1043 (+),score=481.75 GHRR01024003.1:427-3129(+)
MPANRLVTAYLQDVLSLLSIPHGELDQLAASGLSDAALTAWALTKTALHPAAQQAAAAHLQLQQLLAKLDGAMLWQQQAAASPLAQLLWHVAVSAAGQRLNCMDYEELQSSIIEFQVVHAARRAAHKANPNVPGYKPKQVLEELVQHQVHRMIAVTPLETLQDPGFWQLAQQAATRSQGLVHDLAMTGYNLLPAADAATLQLQQLQQWVELDARQLQAQLRQQRKLSDNIFLPGREAELLAAVADDSQARVLFAKWQLLQMLAQALGLTSVHLSGPASACELVMRLTGVSMGQQQQQQIPEQVVQQLMANAPELVQLAEQFPDEALKQPRAGHLMQLMASKPELRGLSQALAAWRAESAAAGYLPVLVTLSQSEVATLSQQQAQALGRSIMQLEAQGRLLLRQAAAGQLEQQLEARDAAALAWKVHTGGQQGAEQLVQLTLAQASQTYNACRCQLDAAAAAISDTAAGFQLEAVTSRRSSVAPPSPLVMAGIPQQQVSDLSKSMPSITSSTSDTTTTDSRSRSLSVHPATAETLVRDLATIMAAIGLQDTASGPAADLPEGPQAAAVLQRLQILAHDLPKVLSGPLLSLLNNHKATNITSAADLVRLQQQLKAFLQVLEVELPQVASPRRDSIRIGTSGSSTTSWAAAVAPGESPAAAEGLLELVGEQDTAGVLAHAATAAAAGRGRRRFDDGEDQGNQEEGLFDMLADIHHDIHMQRYLQMEFDAALELDLVHAPRAWRDADLFAHPVDWLDAMKPLLDRYLVAQGEQPVQEMEWQVYRAAALAEQEQVEIAASATHQAAGHSPFRNSRADEAYLTQRLDTGIKPDNVLYATAHKYLKVSFKNRSWRFAQRKRLVDRLIEIAQHLAAHPPRRHRGSPFSALFQLDGPPLCRLGGCAARC